MGAWAKKLLKKLAAKSWRLCGVLWHFAKAYESGSPVGLTLTSQSLQLKLKSPKGFSVSNKTKKAVENCFLVYVSWCGCLCVSPVYFFFFAKG